MDPTLPGGATGSRRRDTGTSCRQARPPPPGTACRQWGDVFRPGPSANPGDRPPFQCVLQKGDRCELEESLHTYAQVVPRQGFVGRHLLKEGFGDVVDGVLRHGARNLDDSWVGEHRLRPDGSLGAVHLADDIPVGLKGFHHLWCKDLGYPAPCSSMPRIIPSVRPSSSSPPGRSEISGALSGPLVTCRPTLRFPHFILTTSSVRSPIRPSHMSARLRFASTSAFTASPSLWVASALFSASTT